MRDYQVKAGDTLSKIAAEQLGDALRWPSIYLANKPAMDRNFETARSYFKRLGSDHAVRGPEDYLKVGQTLRLP